MKQKFKISEILCIHVVLGATPVAHHPLQLPTA